MVAKLKSGEVAYVTEIEGKYIEVLPNHINNDRYDASLVSANGEFYSTLVIHDKRMPRNFHGVGYYLLLSLMMVICL